MSARLFGWLRRRPATAPTPAPSPQTATAPLPPQRPAVTWCMCGRPHVPGIAHYCRGVTRG